MCTFVANDLNDLESDIVNHPDRPLPRKLIRPAFATTLYFLSLGIGLFSTRYFVEERIAFWYYALFSLSVSYGLVVDYLPTIKAPYVALASSIPVLILAAFFSDAKFYAMSVSAFLITFGRELCLGIRDREGDGSSWLKRIPRATLAWGAFTVQAVGISVLLKETHTLGEFLIVLLMVSILGASAVLWMRYSCLTIAVTLMKLEFFTGLYFLM